MNITLAGIIFILILIILFVDNTAVKIVSALTAIGVAKYSSYHGYSNFIENIEDVEDVEDIEDIEKTGSGQMSLNKFNQIKPIFKKSLQKTKPFIKASLRNLKKGAVSTTSALAVAGTGGAAGDTLIELLVLTIDSTIYLSEMFVFTSKLGNLGQDMWNLNFDYGISGVYDQMQPILTKYRSTSKGLELLNEYCNAFKTSLDKFSYIFGLILSAVVPDDSGVIAWIVSELIIVGGSQISYNLFSMLKSAYNKLIPKQFQIYLEQPEKLEELVNYLLNIYSQIISSRTGDPWYKRVGTFFGRQTLFTIMATPFVFTIPLLSVIMAPLAAGFILSVNILLTSGIAAGQIDGFINMLKTYKFEIKGLGNFTAVEALVLLVRKIIPIMFGSVYLLEECKNNQRSDDAKLINDIDQLDSLPDNVQQQINNKSQIENDIKHIQNSSIKDTIGKEGINELEQTINQELQTTKQLIEKQKIKDSR